MSFIEISDLLGCFESNANSSRFCERRFISLMNKLFEVFVWCTLLAVSITLIEPKGDGNGYKNIVPESNDATDYIFDECEMEREEILWIDYSLDIPGWLYSDIYQSIAGIGAGLSIIECFMFWIIYFVKDWWMGESVGGSGKAGFEDDGGNGKEIELGENKDVKVYGNDGSGGVTTTGDGNGDGGVGLETGDGSEHESDEDVLYDDEEKEMEYVTPGGPTPQ